MMTRSVIIVVDMHAYCIETMEVMEDSGFEVVLSIYGQRGQTQ